MGTSLAAEQNTTDAIHLPISDTDSDLTEDLTDSKVVTELLLFLFRRATLLRRHSWM